ncbi:MAG: glycosyltransferase family 4 protein, partial [Alphaproteobacteria bacterium]|nr:glycosyltransferase family 4 protein [Alphaproteobacteria bacterium]
MLVANPFLHDTRVYKEARSLIEWGCEVHVLALYDRDLPVSEEVDGIHVRRISMRRGDLWRLAAVVLSWWCRPILRRAVGSPVGAEARELRQDHDAHSNASAPRAWFPFAGRPSQLVRAGGSSWWGILRSVYRASLKKYRWARNLVDFVFALRWQMHRGLKRLARRVIAPVLNRSKRLIARVTRVFRAITRRSKRVVPPSLRLLATNLQFARHAIDLQPDVVQSHDLNTLLGGTLVKRLTGVGLVYDSHELFLKRNIGNKSRARDNVIWAPVERFCIGKCDAVLSVAEGICEYLAKQY